MHHNSKCCKASDFSLLSLTCLLSHYKVELLSLSPSQAFSLLHSSVCLFRKQGEKWEKFWFVGALKCLGWSIFQKFLKKFFPHKKVRERGTRERNLARERFWKGFSSLPWHSRELAPLLVPTGGGASSCPTLMASTPPMVLGLMEPLSMTTKMWMILKACDIGLVPHERSGSTIDWLQLAWRVFQFVFQFPLISQNSSGDGDYG